jgi:hypothetical protein
MGGKPPYSFSIGEGTSLLSGFNMGPDGTIQVVSILLSHRQLLKAF